MYVYESEKCEYVWVCIDWRTILDKFTSNWWQWVCGVELALFIGDSFSFRTLSLLMNTFFRFIFTVFSTILLDFFYMIVAHLSAYKKKCFKHLRLYIWNMPNINHLILLRQPAIYSNFLSFKWKYSYIRYYLLYCWYKQYICANWLYMGDEIRYLY